MKYLLVSLMVLMAASASAKAIVLGQVDDFQDGTLSGWSSGGAHLSNIETGGPTGPEDRYLQASTLSYSTDVPLRIANRGWNGDYTGVGISSLEFDLINLGTMTLEIRILLGCSGGDFTSTNSFLLPSDGQWHHAIFSLSLSDMTWGGSYGDGDCEMGLHDVRILTIRHQSGPPLGSHWDTPIKGAFGIDNIRATPEPVTLMMFPLLLFAAWKRHRIRM